MVTPTEQQLPTNTKSVKTLIQQNPATVVWNYYSLSHPSLCLYISSISEQLLTWSLDLHDVLVEILSLLYDLIGHVVHGELALSVSV